MFADLDDIRLHYESRGEGKPVVLVHGLGLSDDMWHHQVPELAARYRVITFDNRGHGGSEKPKGPYDMSMFVEDTRKLLDFLGLDNPVLIGLSMGGGIVQAFPFAYPARVHALGLISTSTEATGASFLTRAETAEREGMAELESLVPRRFAPASLEQRSSEVERIKQTLLEEHRRRLQSCCD